ncbi:NAD-dependent epimerase/dehydratase family protein [Paenibacillus tarimensis]|uniref:NAD-dependent epimerase/dehydratase family protein n=1 Tax=Paenibacillus tarimensis TaxID=416012 RepID=UPI001F43ECFF|nr:SDR family oxidoreductase [Paenibacillus tarimensis]MCF2945196.1 NAD-dependent epimerase/dehydratase family protein [Paenibacillus tarimensis]
MRQKVLVTGAGGYIGSVLVPKLLSLDYAVVALDRFFFGRDKLREHPRLQILQEDNRRIHEACLEGIDAVIDLAALSNDPAGDAFPAATMQINHLARVRTAALAKQVGAKRYILSSSCSVYGYHAPENMVNEESPINPLTVYAKANAEAEKGVLNASGTQFCVTAVRLATVFGCSPRMRFDLAVNGMALGAWSKGCISLMRNGEQWRPLLHVEDAAEAFCNILEADPGTINGQIFNIGSEFNNVQLGTLAEDIARSLPKEPTIEWYGDADHRSYRVDFSKVEALLDWKAKWSAVEGAVQVYQALEEGRVSNSAETYTINWYKELEHWHNLLKQVGRYGGIIDLDPADL